MNPHETDQNHGFLRREQLPTESESPRQTAARFLHRIVSGKHARNIMAVLVTGGAGYIGSHLVLELLDADEQVVVLDNLSTGFRSNVAPGAELIVGDIGNEELVGSLLISRGIQAIFHFAGSIVVPQSVTNPLAYYHNNTAKTRSLIAAAVACKVPHFVFSSTAAVYGIPEMLPIPETTPLLPISPYGSSKMMTELMLADVAKAHPLNYVALRYFNVAGADPKGRTGQSNPLATHLIKIACRSALHGSRSEVQVFGTDYPTGDGTCIRDYVHVSDLARAHLAALHYLRSEGQSQVFNCGYGHGYSVRDVIDTVRRISGVAIREKASPRRLGDPAALVADVSRIQKQLHWRPQLDDLDIIVEHALKWECNLAIRAGALTLGNSSWQAMPIEAYVSSRP
jgi:UDP-glucose 4-epimerase